MPLCQRTRTGPYWMNGTCPLLAGQDGTLVAERKRMEEDRQEMDGTEEDLTGMIGRGPTVGMRQGPIGGTRRESSSLNIACGIKIKIYVLKSDPASRVGR